MKAVELGACQSSRWRKIPITLKTLPWAGRGQCSDTAVIDRYDSPWLTWRLAMARLSRFALAAITAIAVSLLLTYGTYAIRLLAGGPLTRRYIVWSSFLLPIFLGLFAAVWPAPKLKRSALVAGSAGAAIGLAYIYVATRLLFWVVFKRWGGFGHSIFFSPVTTSCDLDLEAFTFAIVFISEPVASVVKLPEPSGTDVIYVQGPDRWRTVPSQVRTLDRYIEIRPPDAGDKSLAGLMIHDAGGWGAGFAVPGPDR